MEYQSVESFIQEQRPVRKLIFIKHFGSYTVIIVNNTKLYVGRVCAGQRYTINTDLTILSGFVLFDDENIPCYMDDIDEVFAITKKTAVMTVL